ncbi:MAG: hypothetical protein ACRCUT_04865 [Spirochaetota bacterium]
MNLTEQQIRELIANNPHLPVIFEILLTKKSFFNEDEEILAAIFLEREGFRTTEKFFEKETNFHPATLIVATTYGLTLVQEGGNEVFEKMYGYRIQHVLYDKISHMQLDICLLSGKFSISCGSGASESVIEFNTAKFYKQFEQFIDILRRQVFLTGR